MRACIMKGHLFLCACQLFGVLVVTVDAEPLELNSATFEESVGSGPVHFVKFYAPWCGHCKRLAPTWDQLADKLDGLAVVAKVDCTVETKLCAEQGVRGYPTLKLFRGNEVIDYRDSRDIDSLMQFVISNSPSDKMREQTGVEVEVDSNGLAHLTDDNLDAFLSSNDGVHFIKFYAPWCGHCQRLAPTWDELAEHFQLQPNVHISKVDCTLHSSSCSRHGVKGYPTLLLFKDGSVHERYNGARTLQDMVEFVNTAVPAQAVKKGVLELTAMSFAQQIEKPALTFVKFYAPWCGHCKSLAPTWDKLAEEIHHSSTTVIAKVDCTSEKSLCSEQDVHGYPTLVMFQAGQRKAEYRGSRDFNSLQQFIDEQATS